METYRITLIRCLLYTGELLTDVMNFNDVYKFVDALADLVESTFSQCFSGFLRKGPLMRRSSERSDPLVIVHWWRLSVLKRSLMARY